MRCQCQRQTTAASAEIQGAKVPGGGPVVQSSALGGQAAKELPALLGEQLGLGAGDEHMTVDGDFEAAEPGGTHNVLQRFAEPPALY